MMGESGNSPVKGCLFVVIAAILWGSMGPFAKLLFEEGISPFELVQIRVTLSSIILAITLGIFSKGLLRIHLKDLTFFILIGSGAMALVQAAYFYAVSKIPVATAVLLQYTAPIMVTLFSIFFLKERLNALKILALILSIGGCFFVIDGYNIQLTQMNKLGIIGGLVSAVSLASYTLLGEKGMHRYPPWTILFYSLLFASLSWHIFYPPFRYLKASYSMVQWGLILYITVACTILTFGFFLAGINHIRSTRASITATLEPISAGFISFFLLGEVMQPLQILGGAMVIGAIILLQLEGEKTEMTPELIRARRGVR
jgi:drug/metabolite transporter (DMT)-like permease